MAARRCWEEAIIIQLQMRCKMRILESLFPSTFIDVRRGRISVGSSLPVAGAPDDLATLCPDLEKSGNRRSYVSPRFGVVKRIGFPRLQVVFMSSPLLFVGLV
jgi:hypothetical protein